MVTFSFRYQDKMERLSETLISLPCSLIAHYIGNQLLHADIWLRNVNDRGDIITFNCVLYILMMDRVHLQQSTHFKSSLCI